MFASDDEGKVGNWIARRCDVKSIRDGISINETIHTRALEFYHLNVCEYIHIYGSCVLVVAWIYHIYSRYDILLLGSTHGQLSMWHIFCMEPAGTARQNICMLWQCSGAWQMLLQPNKTTKKKMHNFQSFCYCLIQFRMCTFAVVVWKSPPLRIPYHNKEFILCSHSGYDGRSRPAHEYTRRRYSMG